MTQSRPQVKLSINDLLKYTYFYVGAVIGLEEKKERWSKYTSLLNCMSVDKQNTPPGVIFEVFENHRAQLVSERHQNAFNALKTAVFKAAKVALNSSKPLYKEVDDLITAAKNL